MDVQSLHPELRDAYKRFPAIAIHHPLVYFLITFIQGVRSRRAPSHPDIAIEDLRLRHCWIRIYRPERRSGAGALWIHGGGYIIGDVSINDRECIRLAQEQGLVVVSVNYRLAPKHRFPAAIDDCADAWRFLQHSAQDWGLDRERIAVVGQSAGGGLAAGLVQRLRDEGGVQPAAQVLIYPMLDDRTAANIALDSPPHILWNNRNNRGAWRWYLGQTPGQGSVPSYAAPARREDLSGLPPAWIGVGNLDLFYAEDCDYAARLQSASVPCELFVTADAPHGFDLIVRDGLLAQRHVQAYQRFLEDRLGLARTTTSKLECNRAAAVEAA